MKLAHAISETVRAGLAGLEPLVGIPGTVGGALHGNSGSRGGDIGQWACRATVMTRAGDIVQREPRGPGLRLPPEQPRRAGDPQRRVPAGAGRPGQLTKRMQKQWIVKKAGQPLSHQNVACVFKNPRGMSAGMLIEQAGLKGTRVGGVEVSQRHANSSSPATGPPARTCCG